MLRIHSFLQDIYGCFQSSFTKKMYRNCVIFVSGTAVITVITFSSQSLSKDNMTEYQLQKMEAEESVTEEIHVETKAKVHTADRLTDIEVQRMLLQNKMEKKGILSEKEKHSLSIVTQGQSGIQQEEYDRVDEGLIGSENQMEQAGNGIETLQVQEEITKVKEKVYGAKEKLETETFETQPAVEVISEAMPEEEGIQEQETPEVKEVLVTDNGTTARYNEFMASVTLTEQEKNSLLHLVAAEAGGCDLVGQILVANVVLNRVESSVFPNTVEGVIFQKNQFSPAGNGAIWSSTITDSVREAVERALEGEDFSQGATFFSARARLDYSSMSWFDNNLNWLFKHDGHEFYSLR